MTFGLNRHKQLHRNTEVVDQHIIRVWTSKKIKIFWRIFLEQRFLRYNRKNSIMIIDKTFSVEHNFILDFLVDEVKTI